MEKKFVLTKTEMNEWEGILNSNISRYGDITELNEIINKLNASAQNFSTRSMEVEDFNASRIHYYAEKTATDSLGIISYDFEWKNFSSTYSGKIYVGDAFSDDAFQLSDNVLIIEIPEGYKVLNSSPTYDRQENNRLIWEQRIYQNFTKGEPAIILSRMNQSEGNINDLTKIPSIIPLIYISIIGLVTFSTAGFMVIFLKRRNSEKKLKRTLYGEIIHAPEMLQDMLRIPEIRASVMQILQKESMAKSVNEIANDDSISDDEFPEPIPSTEILSYEEMIEQFLEKCGGQAFQSKIVEATGLSKSKISTLLADMKEKGRILKIKKGKENLIRLISPAS